MKAPDKPVTNEDAERVAASLLRFWISPIVKRGWDDRLLLLEKIDDEIKEMCETREVHERISSTFTSMLIERMTDVTVTCFSQAYLYLNSANETHRQAAKAWLVLHNSDVGSNDSGRYTPGSEKRCATRHEVELPSIISANDNHFEGKLVDISASGAKVAVTANLIKGSMVEVVVPLLGRVAASVVWVAATFVGLAFVSPVGSVVLGA